jgi:curved DNA-binding protein CbpA
MNEDPFAVLGLPARADLSDEDVRAAWRRIAAATHPDREDGGSPARFGAAAAAYAMLRTSFGRGEALADLAAGAYRPARRSRHRARHGGAIGRRPLMLARHFRNIGRRGGRLVDLGGSGRSGGSGGSGRSGRSSRSSRSGGSGHLAARHAGQVAAGGQAWRLTSCVILAAAGSAGALIVVGWTPGTVGMLAGALTVTGWGLWRWGGWGR